MGSGGQCTCKVIGPLGEFLVSFEPGLEICASVKWMRLCFCLDCVAHLPQNGDPFLFLVEAHFYWRCLWRSIWNTWILKSWKNKPPLSSAHCHGSESPVRGCHGALNQLQHHQTLSELQSSPCSHTIAATPVSSFYVPYRCKIIRISTVCHVAGHDQLHCFLLRNKQLVGLTPLLTSANYSCLNRLQK